MNSPRTITSASQAIDLGIQYHQSGHLAQAQELYLMALRADPNHPDALHLLGMVAHQTGRNDVAVDLIGKAIRLAPSNPIFHNNLGEAYRASRNLPKAVAAYRKSLSLKADLAEAHNNLGLALREQGKLGDAVTSCRRAIALCPDYADAHHNLGLTLQDLHKTDEAIAAYRQTLALMPHHAAAHNSLGLALQEKGSLDEAIASYRQALALAPDYAEAYNNLGNTLKEKGNPEEAVVAYRQAIALRPDLAAAHNNLANVLANQGALDEAIVSYQKALALKPDFAKAYSNLGNALRERDRLGEAIVAYKEALALNPDDPDAHNDLGIALQGQGKQDEAALHYQKALSLEPNFAEAHNNLGNVLTNRGKLEKAEACFRKALSIRPEFADAQNNLGNVFKNQARLDEAVACYRQALSLQPDSASTYSNLLLTLQYMLPLTSEEVFGEAVDYGRRFEEPLKEKWLRHEWSRKHGEPLRVGFVSGDLRSHPVGFFLESILRHMDRESFALYAYANQFTNDSLTERIRPFFKGWIPVKGLTDDELASRIRADGIDILIDLSGHTADNRLLTFARRPAPVQVTWVGYPNTTGLHGIDYILADPITLPPEEEKFYTEKAWRLPDTYLCFTPPEASVAVGPLPALANGYVTFGCFNTPAKLNDDVVACWSEVLRGAPDSILVLKNTPFGDETVCKEFRRRFSRFGIDPARLSFQGRSNRTDYLASYQHIDLALDPFPFPGATTTCDALWMGVPTLTLKTPRGLVGHNGELIMKSVGLPEWVAESVEEYVRKARALAQETDILAAVRADLRQRLLASPLCDAERFAKHLENAFREMPQAAGEAP